MTGQQPELATTGEELAPPEPASKVIAACKEQRGRRGKEIAGFLKQRFREADTNRDGMLNWREFAVLLRKGGSKLTDRQIKGLFVEVDSNKSGKVVFDEFVDYVFAPIQKTTFEATASGSLSSFRDARPPAPVDPDDVACVARIASGPETPKGAAVEVSGASIFQELNGIYVVKPSRFINHHPVYECTLARSFLFYGWRQGFKRVGWFLADELPSESGVWKYTMFNPSPLADAPNTCVATWETVAGTRDKRMFCELIRYEGEDGQSKQQQQQQRQKQQGKEQAPISLDGFKNTELWDAMDNGKMPVEDCFWGGERTAAGEDDDWEREWEHQEGEENEDPGDKDTPLLFMDPAVIVGAGVESPGKKPSKVPVPRFLDFDFEPDEESLGTTMDVVDEDRIADSWDQLTDLHEKLCLFHVIVPEDVIGNGSEDHSWFTSACAAVAEYPSWIQSMFGQTVLLTPNGRYSVRLYHPGTKEFNRIVVDSYVPTKQGAPCFAGLSSDAEAWPALIEKAFAKFCGSYANIAKGTTAFGLLYLCGGGGAESWCRRRDARWQRLYTYWKDEQATPGTTKLDRQKNERMVEDKVWVGHDALWLLLRRYMERCYPACCRLDRRPEEADDRCGLLPDRAYTIISAREVPVGPHLVLRLVLLRNPAGVGEWQGRWSDWSQQWTDHPEVQDMLQFIPRHDGLFWMAYSDFLKHCSVINVAKKSLPVQGSCHYKLADMRRALDR